MVSLAIKRIFTHKTIICSFIHALLSFLDDDDDDDGKIKLFIHDPGLILKRFAKL